MGIKIYFSNSCFVTESYKSWFHCLFRVASYCSLYTFLTLLFLLNSNLPAIGQEDSKGEQWEILYPSISLRDWSIQMLTAPEFGAAKAGTEQLVGDDWLPLSQSQMEDELVKGWPGNWPSRVGHQQKRNIVVADDAAFREKSKLLTAMERQKWLNSYMQKLLVVNSK